MADIQGEPKNQPPFTNPPNLTTNPIQGEAKNQAPFTNAVSAGAGSTSTGLPSFEDIAAAAQAQASQEIGAEIQSQIDPLNRQIEGVQGAETSAIGQIGSMFDSIQPSVQQGATAVQQSYDSAEQMQNAIFSAATAALNKQKQGRAQEAQRLAQQIGGPVAVDEFTAGFDPGITELTQLGAGSMLKTLGYAQAGVQLANAFAGQVFPVLRTEQTAQARQYFEGQIAELRGRIADLNSQKSTLINQRTHDLMTQQLQYQLDQAKVNLDKINANRSYQLDKRKLQIEAKQAGQDFRLKQRQDARDQKRLNADITAAKVSQALEKERVTLAKQEFAIQEAAQTGVYKGKPTLDAMKLTADEKRQARAMDLSEQEYKLRKWQLQESTSLAKKKLAADQKASAAAYMDAAINPAPGKTVKNTTPVPVPKPSAFGKRDPNVYADSGSPTGYSKLVTTVQTPVAEPITDATQLVDYLVSNGVPQSVAVNMVKRRLQLPATWKYGNLTPIHIAQAESGNLWATG